jgi:hypothetical protein
MQAKRSRILDDPERFRREYIEHRLPDDYDDLPEDEQQQIVADLEGVIVAVDPESLREEIQRLGKLIAHAKALEQREVESKLNKLRQVLAGATISVRVTSPRILSSLSRSPAMIVLPAPGSSASKNRMRGSFKK